MIGSCSDFAANRRLLQHLAMGVPCVLCDMLGEYELVMRLDAKRQVLCFVSAPLGSSSSASSLTADRGVPLPRRGDLADEGDDATSVRIVLADISLVGLDEPSIAAAGVGAKNGREEEEEEEEGEAVLRIETLSGDAFTIIPHTAALTLPLAHAISSIVAKSCGVLIEGGNGAARDESRADGSSRRSTDNAQQAAVSYCSAHETARSPQGVSRAPSGRGREGHCSEHNPSCPPALVSELIAQVAELRSAVGRQEAAIGLLVSCVKSMERRMIVAEEAAAQQSASATTAAAGSPSRHPLARPTSSSLVNMPPQSLPVVRRTSSSIPSNGSNLSAVSGEVRSPPAAANRPSTRPHRAAVPHNTLNARQHRDPSLLHSVLNASNASVGQGDALNPEDEGDEVGPRVRFVPRPATAGGILRPTHTLVATDDSEILHPPQRHGNELSDATDATDDDGALPPHRARLPSSTFEPRLTTIPSPHFTFTSTDGVQPLRRGMGGGECPFVTAARGDVAPPRDDESAAEGGSTQQLEAQTEEDLAGDNRHATAEPDSTSGSSSNNRVIGRRAHGRGGGSAVGLGDLGEDIADAVRQHVISSQSQTSPGGVSPRRGTLTAHGASIFDGEGGGDEADLGDAPDALVRAYLDIHGSSSSDSDDSSSSGENESEDEEHVPDRKQMHRSKKPQSSSASSTSSSSSSASENPYEDGTSSIEYAQDE